MSEVIPETGNTDFSIRRGKLQIRLSAAFGALMVLLQLLTSFGIWFSNRLVTRKDFETVINRVEDHENRLRQLEHKP